MSDGLKQNRCNNNISIIPFSTFTYSWIVIELMAQAHAYVWQRKLLFSNPKKNERKIDKKKEANGRCDECNVSPLVTLINKPLLNDDHNLLGHAKLNMRQMSGINHNGVMTIVQGV